MKKSKIIIYLIIFTNLILVACQFYFSSRRATDGVMLSQLYQKLSALKLENNRLSQHIYSYSALTNIAYQAQIFGSSTLPTNFFTAPPVAQVQ